MKLMLLAIPLLLVGCGGTYAPIYTELVGE